MTVRFPRTSVVVRSGAANAKAVRSCWPTRPRTAGYVVDFLEVTGQGVSGSDANVRREPTKTFEEGGTSRLLQCTSLSRTAMKHARSPNTQRFKVLCEGVCRGCMACRKITKRRSAPRSRSLCCDRGRQAHLPPRAAPGRKQPAPPPAWRWAAEPRRSAGRPRPPRAFCTLSIATRVKEAVR